MCYCWRNRLPRIEMLKSQVDSSGYDLVLEPNAVMRHIQLKSSHVGAATPRLGINIELANKPSGCVVWIFFDSDSLRFSHFLWFGQPPGERLASLDDYQTGTHNKRKAEGIKTERPSIKYLHRAAFIRLDTIEDVVIALFGEQSDQNLDQLVGIAVSEV